MALVTKNFQRTQTDMDTINLLNYINDPSRFDQDELISELNNFVEEFNNWLTANFNESYCEKSLIKSYESVSIGNTMFEGYCDKIRIHSQLFIRPIRYAIVEAYNLAQYKAAVKQQDINWLAQDQEF